MRKRKEKMQRRKFIIPRKKQEKGYKRPPYSSFESGFDGESLSNKIGRFRRGIRRSIQRIRYGYDEVATWQVDTWFLNVVPNIIHDLRVNNDGYPTSIAGETEAEKVANWNKILRRMEFLFREANEDTCKRKNPYKEEYDAAWEAFTKEYGARGEKLKTEKDLAEEIAYGWHHVYGMSDVKGYYADINAKYIEENAAIAEYRHECLKKGMKLFTKYFWHLWD